MREAAVILLFLYQSSLALRVRVRMRVQERVPYAQAPRRLGSSSHTNQDSWLLEREVIEYVDCSTRLLCPWKKNLDLFREGEIHML